MSDFEGTVASIIFLHRLGHDVKSLLNTVLETASTDDMSKVCADYGHDIRGQMANHIREIVYAPQPAADEPAVEPAAEHTTYALKASSSSSSISEPKKKQTWADITEEDEEKKASASEEGCKGGKDQGGKDQGGKDQGGKGQCGKGRGGKVRGGRGGKGKCNDDEAREKAFVATIYCANKGKKCTRWCEESGMRTDGKCFTHGEAARAGTECFGMNHVNTPDGYGEFPTGWHNNNGYHTGIPNAKFSLAYDETGVKCIYKRVGGTPAWWDKKTGKWQKEVITWEKSDENAYEAFQIAARAAAAAKWAESQNS